MSEDVLSDNEPIENTKDIETDGDNNITDIIAVDDEKMSMPIEDMPITLRTLEMLATLPTTPERWRGKPRDMLAAILVAREVGVLPMSAINNLYLVDGDVSMKGKLMSALVHRAGHQIRLKITDKKVTATAWRRDPYTHKLEEMGSFSFGDADAKRAGLSDKPSYQNFPTIMYSWRALASCARLYFGDVLEGVTHIPDEFGIDVTVEPLPDEVEVEVDGQVMEAEVVDEATQAVVEGLDAEAIR